MLEHRLEHDPITGGVAERKILGDAYQIHSGKWFHLDIDDIRAVAPDTRTNVRDHRALRKSRHKLPYEIPSIRRAIGHNGTELLPMPLDKGS
jgi:hypothetical protein